MAPDSFPQFCRLPFELRCMIYLHASPPRFVHVKEHHEDREAFEERFRTTPVQVQLHPWNAYFARNWRDRIPWPPAPWRPYYRHHQPTLETYGFAVPRQRHQPWVSTAEVPGIPHHFLSENPCVAWEFVRNGSFYSTAPIPTLLHVSAESRHVLIGSGYELAFRTRTSGPLTWFNFKTDTLYLGRVEGDWPDRPMHSLLSANDSWDVGQFDPAELKRTKRLALELSSHTASSSFQDSGSEISHILELFTNVEELFLEECLTCTDVAESARARPGDSPFWFYTPALEVDVLLDAFKNDGLVRSTGYGHRDLRFYKRENMGDGSRYFVDAASRFEEKLTRARDELVRRGSLTPWKIPKIRLVHIGYEWEIRDLFEHRWKVWNEFQVAKEAGDRAKAVEEARRSIDVPRRHIYHDDNISPPYPVDGGLLADLAAYEDEILDEYYPYSAYMEESEERARYSWFLNETIAAPEIS